MIHLIESRSSRPADDPIFALNREANERRRSGDAIVNATVGALLDDDGKLAVLPTSTRAIREIAGDGWAAYAPIVGPPDYLAAVIAELLGTTPTLAATATAAATPGGTGALRHAIANYLEPGQALLTSSFYWDPYQTLAEEAGRTVHTFPMFDADGEFDIAGFDSALRALIVAQGRALIFLNDPCHNPTGYSLRQADWRAAVEVIGRHAATAPVTLLLDVAYAAYGTGKLAEALIEIAPLLGKAGLLFAWSASKTFTHYGLRVGALVVCEPDESTRTATQAALSYSCRGTWSNCNAGGMKAITRLITDPAMRSACDSERAVLLALLRTRADAFNRLGNERGLRFPRYEGGFFVTVFHDAARVKAAAMRELGVYVVPMGGGLRVGICSVATRDIERLVDALA